ncbi:MAG: zinc ABC transporter substrate-binding protein [Pseudomonadota bacterium]
MSRKLPTLACLAAATATTAAADVPNVAADIAPVHALVARVMDGVGTPDLVIAPGASPHEYSLRPSEAAALQDADLVFWVGEGLTPWLEGAIDNLATSASVTALLEADGITTLPFRESALFEAHDHDHGEHDHGDHDDHDDHDHAEEAAAEDHDHDHAEEAAAKEEDHDHDHDHSEDAAMKEDDHDHDHDDHADADGHEGHAHGDEDPHAWLSPDNASVWLTVIAEELAAADPENAATYRANAAAGQEEIIALKAEIDGILAPARGHAFVVFHDAYQYFETAFDLPAAGAISLSDASDPSPARITEVQGRIADEGIDCVLAEPQFSPGLVATVLDGADAKSGIADPLGAAFAPGMDHYANTLRSMAESLAECLAHD